MVAFRIGDAMDVVALADVHLDRAAKLLAERHARERAAEPCLPAVGDYLSQIERELEGEKAVGAVAVQGEAVLAYLVGRPDPDGVVRVGLAGCAADQPEALRDVYAFLAADWVAAGWTRHALLVPASAPELIDVWFRLAFGCQFMLAVRETEPVQPIDFGGLIRPSEPGDLSAIASFDKVLVDLQAGSPSFSGEDPSPLAHYERDWSDVWDEAAYTHFVAERDGRVLGHALLYLRPPGDLRVPTQGNIDLSHAATLPEVRGSGVGLALTAFVLRWAYEHGFASMTADWRSVNLLSSRFWPKRGFRATHLRLYRAVP